MPYEHLNTPRKAAIRGAKRVVDALAANGIIEPVSIRTLADALDETKTSVDRAIRSDSDRRRYERRDIYSKDPRFETPNEKKQKTDTRKRGFPSPSSKRKRSVSPDKNEPFSTPKRRRRGDEGTRGLEPRGRQKNILETPELKRIKSVIEDNGPDGHYISNGDLKIEAELPNETTNATLELALRRLGLGRRIPSTREEIDDRVAALRVEESKEKLRTRPAKEDYRDIFFLDEFHFGIGQASDGTVLRGKGDPERYKIDNVLIVPTRETTRKKAAKKGAKGEKRENDGDRRDEETKNKHYLAIIGYDFPLTLYEYIPTNSNGKMSTRLYIKLLRDIVLPIAKANPTAIFEEDRDSSHSTPAVLKFKRENGIKFYLNTPNSPDFSVVESCASISKREFRKAPRLTKDSVGDEAIRSLDAVSPEAVHSFYDSMPARYKECIRLEGQRTRY